jgi:O-antigen/teichoic acid export membrane protein
MLFFSTSKSIFQGINRFDWNNITDIAQPLIATLGFFILIFLGNGGVHEAIIIQTASILLTCGISLGVLYWFTKFQIGFSLARLRKTIGYGIPNHILQIILIAIDSLPIYILKSISEVSLIAQFTIIFSILGIIKFVGLSVAATTFAKTASMKDFEIHRFVAETTKHTVLIILVIAGPILIFGPNLIVLLFGQKYSPAAQAIQYFIPGVLFRAIAVLVTRDFLSREKPLQHIPIISFSIGLLIDAALLLSLIYFSFQAPLVTIGHAYNLANLIPLLILAFIFLKDSKIPLKDFLLKKSDYQVYISFIRSFLPESFFKRN